jgi:hypothetical protein
MCRSLRLCLTVQRLAGARDVTRVDCVRHPFSLFALGFVVYAPI